MAKPKKKRVRHDASPKYKDARGSELYGGSGWTAARRSPGFEVRETPEARKGKPAKVVKAADTSKGEARKKAIIRKGKKVLSGLGRKK